MRGLGIRDNASFFNRFGIMSLLIESLKMWEISSEISNANSHKNQLRMPSAWSWRLVDSDV